MRVPPPVRLSAVRITIPGKVTILTADSRFSYRNMPLNSIFLQIVAVQRCAEAAAPPLGALAARAKLELVRKAQTVNKEHNASPLSASSTQPTDQHEEAGTEPDSTMKNTNRYH
eukprot:SAG31_NODE_561_length_14087_cov_5.151405_7_plen_114_part_00